MKPASFTYHRPGSVPQALALLGEHGAEAKVLAGGQSLVPMLNMRLARPGHLIDLNDLVELDSLRRDGPVMEIGALTRHHRLATAPELRRELPLLAAAAATIGHYAIRQRGTLGGSLVHADPAAQLPLVAVTLDAEVVIIGPRGRRTVPAVNFLQSVMTVELAPDEIVIALRVPVQPPEALWDFQLFSRRHGDFALVSVALSLACDAAGRIAALRIGLGGVGAVPLRLPELEASATGRPSDDRNLAELAAAAAAAIAPEDTPQVPAAYRRELVETLVFRALRGALERKGAA